VASFKAPSAEDLDHDYLWRCQKHLPERGRIGIFNRSYYEEVLVVRVHPELLGNQKLPGESFGKGLWQRRGEEGAPGERVKGSAKGGTGRALHREAGVTLSAHLPTAGSSC
jgi:hypothetical protein